MHFHIVSIFTILFFPVVPYGYYFFYTDVLANLLITRRFLPLFLLNNLLPVFNRISLSFSSSTFY